MRMELAFPTLEAENGCSVCLGDMPSDGEDYASEYDDESVAGDNSKVEVAPESEVLTSTQLEDIFVVEKSPHESIEPLDPTLFVNQTDRDEERGAIALPLMSNGRKDSSLVLKKEATAPPRRLASDVARIQRLERLLSQSKKVNADLRNQLQQLYRNDAIAQLENRAKEKQVRIEELSQENKLLKQQQRQLSKELESFHESKDSFPTERKAMKEQLRVYKDKIRQLKDACQSSDEKLSRLHQQVVDLTTRNKTLTEQLRQHEEASANPAITYSVSRLATQAHNQEIDTIIESQEEEITRLQQRVALMKKSHRTECAKYEKQLKASQDEIEAARQQMEAFEAQFSLREKTARAQFLSLKTLKRAVHELALANQSNQHLEQLLTQREMRYSNGRSPHAHGHKNQPLHRKTSARQVGPEGGLSRSDSITHRHTERIYDTLLHLGYVPALASTRQDPHQSTDTTIPHLIDEPQDLNVPTDVEFVQGKLMPRPPPPMTGGTTRNNPVRGNSARATLHSTRSPFSSREEGRRDSSYDDNNGATESEATGLSKALTDNQDSTRLDDSRRWNSAYEDLDVNEAAVFGAG